MTRPRKSLLALFGILGVIALLMPVWGPGYDEFFNLQFRHLRQIEAHIRAIEPRWQTFQAEHIGFEDIHFFAYTGGDGLFGAEGSVASSGHLERLREFMQSTAPPRGVYVGVVRVLDDYPKPQK